MTETIRPCEPGEVGLFLSTCFAAFGASTDDRTVERMARVLDPGRLRVAFDDDRPIGSAGTIAHRLSVPGGEIAAAGVTMVGVAADRRRQGVFRRLIESLLADARRRGDAIAVLWSTQGDMYAPFGFGLSALAARIDLGREGAALRAGGDGRVRLVEAEEAPALFGPVYERVRSRTPAMSARSPEWWRSWRLAPLSQAGATSPLFCALVERGGEPEGYAVYRVHGSWELGRSAARLDVIEAMGATPAATQTVWRYLLGLDLVERVRALHLPIDHPLLMLMREPARLKLTITDALWARLLDVRAALGGRGYAGEDALVLDLVDEQCPWNTGRWLLEAGAGGASVERTSRPPDVSLTAEELGAVYFGGTSFAQLERAGRLACREVDVSERLDRLFRTANAPWCPEEF